MQDSWQTQKITLVSFSHLIPGVLIQNRSPKLYLYLEGEKEARCTEFGTGSFLGLFENIDQRNIDLYVQGLIT